MCGIFGFNQLTDSTRRIAPFLAWAMEARGRDAWGCTDGERVIKHVGSIEQSWELPDWTQGIFHTRAATHGTARDTEHAHPFSFQKPDGSWVRGIHNGVINNHKELNQVLNRTFAVDSMHIFANLAEGRGWKDLEGWMACAWYEDGEIYILKHNMYDLHCCQLQGGELVFCSLLAPLEKAANFAGNPVKKNYQIEEDHRYHLKMDSLYDCGKEEFIKKVGRVATVYPASGSAYGFWDNETKRWYDSPRGRVPTQTYTFNSKMDNDTSCYGCIAGKIDRKKQLLCDTCFAKAVQGTIVIEEEPTIYGD